MTHPAITDNDQRVTAAIAAGARLHAGITLSYVGGSSDKFWTAVWAKDQIAVNFGPHTAQGQFQLRRDIGGETGAAKTMWQLLRSKVGKGYTVVDATLMVVSPAALSASSALLGRHIIDEWNTLRDARAVNPRRPLNHPELNGISPRTAKEGSTVLLAMTDPHPTAEALLAGAVADPTERFLPHLALSHPEAPDEARFMAALMGSMNRPL